MPKEDRRIVDIDAYPWDAWFGLRANGTIIRWSSFGYSEFEASEEGDEPCITSIDANGTLAGTSYEGSATMIDYVILAYEGLEFPFTLELPEPRNVVAVSATANFVLLDDQSTAWVYWQDRAPDGTTGHQRLELVSLPQPVVQLAGDDGLCFLNASGRVHCVDPRVREEAKYGLGAGLAPEGVFELPLEDVTFLEVGTFHLCAITMDGRAWCAGYGGLGELGVPGEQFAPTFERPFFDVVPGIPPLERVWLRFGSTCGATADGELWCWGRDIEVPDAIVDVMPPTHVGTFPGLLDVALSDSSTCVLRADHRVLCRGTLPDFLACGREDGWYVMGIDGCDPLGGEP